MRKKFITRDWQTAQSKMERTGNAGTTKDLLAHLLTGDRQATTNTLLHVLSDSNDEDGNDGCGDDNDDGLHVDNVEDDDNVEDNDNVENDDDDEE